MSRFVPDRFPEGLSCNTNTPKHNPMNSNQPKLHYHAPLPGPEEILKHTRELLRGITPFISFGIAQEEALLKASFIGATPDLDRSIQQATRHTATVDQSDEAVAAVHAGMMLVAALKAGVHPADAGLLATETVCGLLGVKRVLGEPELEY